MVHIRAVLIAQDSHKLYIAKSHVKMKLTSFMRNKTQKTITRDEFQNIRQYGRWRTYKRGEVARSAELVLAVALQARSQNPYSSDERSQSEKAAGCRGAAFPTIVCH